MQKVVSESANPARRTRVSGSHWSSWLSASDGQTPRVDTLLPIARWSWAGFPWKDGKERKGCTLQRGISSSLPWSGSSENTCLSHMLSSSQLMIVEHRRADLTYSNPDEVPGWGCATDRPNGSWFLPLGCINWHLLHGEEGLSLLPAMSQLKSSLSPSHHSSLMDVTDLPWLILGHSSSLLN